MCASDEFGALASDDEAAGRLLLEAGRHRSACVCFVQAMEKAVRAKVFSLVDPGNAYFRQRHRTHSLEDALNFLVEVVSLDEQVRTQVRQILDAYVVDGTAYQHLHNDLRYPAFSERHQSFSILEIEREDAVRLSRRLDYLKTLLADLDRFAR